MPFAVIVGGGVSGLSLGHQLRSRGKDVAVLEAREAPGGTIRSVSEGGLITEDGPNGFLDREPAMQQLLASLRLTASVRIAEPTTKKRFVLRGGTMVPVPASPPAFLTSPLLTPVGKLRVLAETLVRRSASPEDESLASFGRRRFGLASVPLLDAIQAGIYAGDVERLSLRAAFPQLYAMEQQHRSVILGAVRAARQSAKRAALCSFEGGLGTLVRALSASLGDSLRSACAVEGLVREGTRWRVGLADGSHLVSDHVILAVPAFLGAKLVRPLDAALAQQMDGIEYAKMAVVHLAYPRAAFAEPPAGFGFLAPREGSAPGPLGCIFVSSIFPWRAPTDQVLFTCMVGGAAQPDLVDWPDDRLQRLAHESLVTAVHVRSEPSYARLVRWQRGIPQYNVGHASSVAEILRRASALPGLHLAGNAFRGIGMNDCVRTAVELSDAICGGIGAG